MSSPSPQLEGRLAQIADAARELIAERGFEGLRTRDIAARAGINVATLHYHVPTKEALISVVAESLKRDFMEQHRAHPREGRSPRERLEIEMGDFRETMTKDPVRLEVLAELSARAVRDPAVAAVIAPMHSYWHGEIARIMADGVASADFRADVDPQAAATMIIGTMTAARRALPDLTLFDRACAELLRAMVATSKRA